LPLAKLGQHGRWVLPFGLLLGFSLPGPAKFLVDWIPHLIALLLLVACLQIKQAIDPRRVLSLTSCKWVLLLQLVLPIGVWLLLTLLQLPEYWITPAVLVACAAPLTGGPSLVIMLKGDARQALDFLLAGTLLLPLTCFPSLLLIDASGSVKLVAFASLKLMLLIVFVVTVAGVIRRYWLKLSHYRDDQTMDGLSAVLLALVVIGLMAGFHEEGLLISDLALTLAWAIAINVIYQFVGYAVAKWQGFNAIASGVLTGNRNIALFLVALSTEASAPLLLFLACYQIPMYLTPLLGGIMYPKQVNR